MNQPLTPARRLISPRMRLERRRIVEQIRADWPYAQGLSDQQAFDTYVETAANTYRLDVSLWESITECDRLLGELPSEPHPVPPDLLLRALRLESRNAPRSTYALTALLLTQENRSLKIELERLEEQDYDRAILYATVPHTHPARSN